MAIVINKPSTESKRALIFEDLKQGDIFSNGNYWFIKIADIYEGCDLICNAIALNDGDYALFDDDQTVTKLKKDLIIDYSNDDITEWYEN